jgi:hypothetical protein
MNTRWYRGDCHVHSAASHGGELTPKQLAADARAAGLDFIATTEHNRTDTHGLWSPHAGDDLLVILGQEVVTRTGHWLALGLEPAQLIDWDYDVTTAGAADSHLRALREVRTVGGLCVAAHPHAPYESGTLQYPIADFDLIEVWNGLWSSSRPWNADNEAGLADWAHGLSGGVARGRWRPAIGNSDIHLADQQLGMPQTVVLAEEPSTRAILAGLRAGQSWIAESSDIDLSFIASSGDRSAGTGQRLDTNGEVADVVVSVRRGVPAGTVSIHTDLGEVHRQVLGVVGSGIVRWSIRADESSFVRAEVRHPNGAMAAITNPIIVA